MLFIILIIIIHGICMCGSRKFFRGGGEGWEISKFARFFEVILLIVCKYKKFLTPLHKLYEHSSVAVSFSLWVTTYWYLFVFFFFFFFLLGVAFHQKLGLNLIYTLFVHCIIFFLQITKKSTWMSCLFVMSRTVNM